jgi:uncharacterized coiled-coil protein SlyX
MSEQQEELSRLDELESRAAFQDDLIEMARRVRALETRLAELAEAASLPGAGGGHEVPPHY